MSTGQTPHSPLLIKTCTHTQHRSSGQESYSALVIVAIIIFSSKCRHNYNYSIIVHRDKHTHNMSTGQTPHSSLLGKPCTDTHHMSSGQASYSALVIVANIIFITNCRHNYNYSIIVHRDTHTHNMSTGQTPHSSLLIKTCTNTQHRSSEQASYSALVIVANIICITTCRHNYYHSITVHRDIHSSQLSVSGKTNKLITCQRDKHHIHHCLLRLAQILSIGHRDKHHIQHWSSLQA
jgi:hypothetical protein